MAEPTPLLDQINLVVADMDATLAFYRLLGLEFADTAGGEWPPGTGARHAETTLPNGFRLEFDDIAMARIWHSGWLKPDCQQSRVVIGFSLTSRDEVDAKYSQLTTTGYAGRQPPYDAFWGARYAIVADPDGNDVGIMSPIDPEKRYTPTA